MSADAVADGPRDARRSAGERRAAAEQPRHPSRARGRRRSRGRAAAEERGGSRTDEEVSLEAILEDLKRREGRIRVAGRRPCSCRPDRRDRLREVDRRSAARARGAVVDRCGRARARGRGEGTPGFDRVVERFGPDVVAPGRRPRPAGARGDRIFSDPAAAGDLEAIVHPEVAPAVRRTASTPTATRTASSSTYAAPDGARARPRLRRGRRGHGEPASAGLPGGVRSRPVAGRGARPDGRAGRRTSNARRSPTS